jgi:hypothetical protein
MQTTKALVGKRGSCQSYPIRARATPDGTRCLRRAFLRVRCCQRYMFLPSFTSACTSLRSLSGNGTRP